MIYAITLTAFTAVALLAWAALSSVFSDERVVAKRLTGLNNYEGTLADQAYPQFKPFYQRVLLPGGNRLKSLIGAMAPQSYRDRVAQRLVLAGNPRGVDVGRVLVAKTFGAAGTAMLLLAVGVILNISGPAALLMTCVAIASYWFPDLWMLSRTQERQKSIQLALPDMMDMLTISVEAGLGFDQAITKIVRMTDGPLAQEFARMLQEVQAGTDRTTALRRLGERTAVSELDGFITAIVQAESMGVPIAKVLRTQAGDMRLSRRQRAEEQGQKTPVKIVFPLILCILPATLIVVIGPAIIGIGKAFGAW